MSINFEPLGDRVVIYPIAKEEKTKSGLVLVNSIKEGPLEGEVIAVGPGRVTDSGEKIQMNVKVGDIVSYIEYGGINIKIEGIEYTVIVEGQILGKKQKEN